MKVGILTFTNGTNIGQRLQNYALQEILCKMGFEVWTIRQSEPYSHWQLFKSATKSLIKNAKNHQKTCEIKKRNKQFENFNQRNIRLYPQTLPFYGDNSWIKKDFDAFIVGSDQIWNPKSPYVGDNFFLGFADEHQRYTYAPSFSVEEIEEHSKAVMTKRLNCFSSISVREDRGAEIIKNLTGKDAQVVLDPTLMLSRDEWNKIKVKSPLRNQEKYILSVFLGSVPNSELQQTTDLLHCKLIHIDNTTPIDPSQFLDLAENAELIMTDSYHVTVFSTVYHIPFINFQRKGTTNDMNSRFKTLYRELGIQNRQWDYLKDHHNEILTMDYQHIDECLKAEQTQSQRFLENTIGLLVKRG